jgi:hypothetical protein
VSRYSARIPILRGDSQAGTDDIRQREQAEEGGYIRKRELEKLKAAQDKVKAAQAELVCRFPPYSCPQWFR